jgi:hypothetical protein
MLLSARCSMAPADTGNMTNAVTATAAQPARSLYIEFPIIDVLPPVVSTRPQSLKLRPDGNIFGGQFYTALKSFDPSAPTQRTQVERKLAIFAVALLGVLGTGDPAFPEAAASGCRAA